MQIIQLPPPKWWMIPVQWALLVLQNLFTLLGTVAGIVMVPLAIWLGWDTRVLGYRVFWPWAAYDNPSTKMYYDPWYANPDSSTHHAISLWAWNKGGFWREFYWRTRNSFSNGARYLNVGNAKWEVDENGVYSQPTVYRKNWASGYYQYDTERWWLGKLRYRLFNSPASILEYYIGWKFERHEGFGSAHRGLPAILTIIALAYLLGSIVFR